VIAILGGLGAALMWATSNLTMSRATRLIPPASVLAWIMVVGLLADGAAIAVTRTPFEADADTLALLAVGGLGNVVGLLLLLTALRIGKAGPVATICSTEGAVAASYAAIGGEVLAPLAYGLLALIVIGLLLTSLSPDPEPLAGERPRLSAGLAVLAALSFGAGIYAIGRASAEIPVLWAILPPRIAGVVLIAVPLAVLGRLRLTRKAFWLVLVIGMAELLGFVFYAVGARDSISIAAVLASLFGAFVAVGAYLLFRERLGRWQIVGVVVIAAGVASLAATRG